uniref:Major facilitator superfamily (MFS) profile domain-containing protein n=1 Tax=Amphimedon queenslandica TaxID=400682 RepID=A0A1X7VGP5_AMPQE
MGGSTMWLLPGYVINNIGIITFAANIIQYNIDQLIGGSANELIRVLCYARKHKYPENRSALTYWEEEAPSRLDLGKDKYGGPFTEEEVEDVKTFFRMLPLFTPMLGFGFVLVLPSSDCSNMTLVNCVMLIYTDAFHITVLLLFFIYQFIIRGCFHKYIPSMLTRMGAGILFGLCCCISQLLVQQLTSYELLLITEQVLLGISLFLIYPTSLEFTVAQSPEHMRGMMVGFCYTSLGIGSLLALVLLDFLSKRHYVYYLPTKCCILLLILIVFVILAKRYKYRVRENEVNIVKIVDEHYQRYMEQKDEYEKEQDYEIYLED